LTNLTNRFQKIALSPWLAEVVALLGGLYYLLASRFYAHAQLSRLDEGLYQVKGFYFASGRYTPFQDYGLWTNHMPLSFLIPGFIQNWLGPGIRTGRYFAIFLGTLALLGMWLLVRRLGGRWWAAVVVLVFALNTAWVQVHSLGLSNVTVTFFLVWTLFFAIGEKRKSWHFLAAGLFAGLLMLTRINLAPLVGLLPLYILWQHGRKPALLTGAVAFGVVALVHAIYWPGIMTLWAYWVPEGLFSFLAPWVTPARKTYVEIAIFPITAWLGDFDHIVWDSIRSFLHGVRFNFISFVGVLGTLLLWPKRKAWKSNFAYKTVVFLTVAYMFLLGFHMWAALLGKSCHIWCFSNYMMFFNPLGIVILVLAFSSWEKIQSSARKFSMGLSVALLGMGIGLGSIEETSNQLVNLKFPKITLSPFSYQSRAYILWGQLERRLGIPLSDSHRIIPSVVGLLVALGLIILVIFGLRGLHQRSKLTGVNWGWGLIVLVLIIGLVFSPVTVLGGGLRTHQCTGDVIAAYETAGEELASLIPAGSQLFSWYKPTLPLLSIPQAQIYPPQMNFTFSLMYPDEILVEENPSDALLRYGFWDEVLKEEWLAEADYVLVEGHRFPIEWADRVASGEFEIYAETSPTEPCRGEDSRIIILRRP
jgi:hypothetical protein